jgi:putative peptide zinc metalloprotease protein
VAGVSTLVFNGNPLLRYDAYYILADLAELPNLAQRSTRYWGYLVERYVLRGRDAVSPAETRSERLWFGFYGVASTAYRLFVTFVIALFIGSRFFFIGVLLALWAVANMAVMPIVRAFRQLNERPGLRERRGRILAATGGVLAVLAMLALWLPMPDRTQAEGVVWLPEQATLRAGAPGFVHRVLEAPGQPVRTGTLLIHSVEPGLDAQLRVSEARAAGLNVAAGVDGTFTLAEPNDMPGRFYRQGEVLGYVLGEVEPIVRVVVEQAEVDGVARSVRSVRLRLSDDLGRVIPGRVVREVPAGSDEAPSRALIASGGGRLAVDPRDPEGRRTLARVFQIDVAPLEPFGREVAYGQRVYVRFEKAPAPLATQGYRALRRLFLRHFSV